MTLDEILAELPLLSNEERWQGIERAMELDEFSAEEVKLINDRIAEYDAAPETWIPMEELLAELRKKHLL